MGLNAVIYLILMAIWYLRSLSTPIPMLMNMLVAKQVVQAALNHVSQLQRLHKFKALYFLI